MDSEESPQVTGVVIITLPPPDNPSLGKTITAFTLTEDDDNSSSQSDQSDINQRQQQECPPIQSSHRRFFTSFPKKVLGFLGISLFALVLYNSVFSHTVREFYKSDDGDDDKNSKQSFMFPLYHKFGVVEASHSDVQFKLGRFVDLDRESVVEVSGYGVKKRRKINNNFNTRLVSANAARAVVDSSTIFPVGGNVYPDGLYFTKMSLGNPPRSYFLDIDTGSDLTWIQCDAPCTSCAKGANPLYKPRPGSVVPSKDALCVEIQKYQKAGYCRTCQQCDYEIEYADRSSSLGVLSRDELHLSVANGSLSKLDVVFGCGYDQQGLLLNTLGKTDGILGLSRAKISLPSQLATQGIINNVVGHCLDMETSGGGYMFLGDGFVPKWGMTWIPMLDSSSIDLYHTEVVKLNYGSSPLSLGGKDGRVGRVFFDTGSSYTYFMKRAYTELVAALEEVVNAELTRDASDPTLPICWQSKFPVRSVMDVKHYFRTLTLQFESKWWIVSTKLRIPPESYLIISKKGNVCLGILDGSQAFDGSTIVLGDISLRGQLVVYDNKNRRIGWKRSDCIKPGRFNNLQPFFEGHITGTR